MEAGSVDAWLMLLGLGMLAGAVGQTIRVVVGLKKAIDVQPGGASDTIDTKRLVISLLIGAAAGAIAAVLTVTDAMSITSQTVLGLVAAGYAGTDFIEGVMKKVVPA
ncbi:MAG: hypothetical protein AAFS07_09280 [Pseudomonadota bacterium]